MALRETDPRVIGGYRLEDRLGTGGMGVVYRARSASGRQVAVKVIRPELAEHAAFRARFRLEVEAARRVSGAFTASVVDADADAEAPWLATVFIAAPTLSDRVEEQGPLSVAQLRWLAAGLAEALRDIHRAGLVHRDLKPGNVLLADDGPRVIDFGIARALDAAPLTTTGAIVGTPPFMAPEQFRRGAVGPATDVFALGSVLVYAATGRGPFDGDGVHAMGFRVVFEEPDLVGLPVELRPLVTACLAKDAAQRPTVERLLAWATDGVEPVVEVPAAPDPPAVLPPVAPPSVTPSSAAPPLVPLPSSSPPSSSPPSPVPPSPSSPAPPGRPGRPARRRAGLALALGASVIAVVAVALTVVLNGPERPGGGAGAATGGTGSAGSPVASGPAAPCGPVGRVQIGGDGLQEEVMDRWIVDYMRICPGAELAHDSLSAGTGFQQFLSGWPDLAFTEASLTSRQIIDSGRRCVGGRAVQLPLSVLPIAVAYRVEGVDALVLDAATIAQIFDGRITVWNDAKIARLNPQAVLPAARITVFRPSDDSSTTLTFTRYLATAAPADWAHLPARSWPIRGGQPASAGDLAREVTGTNGAISFVPAGAARQLRTVRLATGAPAPVAVDTESAGRAAGVARIVGSGADLALDVDFTTSTEGAYPIIQIGYALVCDRGNVASALGALRPFVVYAVGADAQRSAAGLGYGTLPPALAQKVRAAVQTLA
ncbi:serine/threonine-protein kinase [Kitasatospora sp. NPDC058170]|uniref:serine/threonine-protein kinase n=1 Tax=Kitasatospora sp. NPDC058170 TaxID=3346364 RepID=UPI0036D8021E